MTVNYAVLCIRRKEEGKRGCKTKAATAPAFLFPADGLAYVFKGHLEKRAIQSARPGSKRQMAESNRNEDGSEMALQWCPEPARMRPGEGGGERAEEKAFHGKGSRLRMITI